MRSSGFWPSLHWNTVSDRGFRQIPLNQQQPPDGEQKCVLLSTYSVHRTGIIGADDFASGSSSEVKPLPGRKRVRRDPDALPEMYKTRGFWDDLKTGRWMLIPGQLQPSFILSLY